MILPTPALYIRHLQIFPTVRINSQFGAKTNGDQDVLQLYAKNYGGDELTTTITTSDINWNIFTIDEIVVTNNTLEIGVYTVAGADDWCNLDMAILRKVE